MVIYLMGEGEDEDIILVVVFLWGNIKVKKRLDETITGVTA